jgi:hypothetical protein
MAGNGAGAHTIAALILHFTVAVATLDGVMSKRSGTARRSQRRHKVKRSRLQWLFGATDFLTPVWLSYILADPAEGWDELLKGRIGCSSDPQRLADGSAIRKRHNGPGSPALGLCCLGRHGRR